MGRLYRHDFTVIDLIKQLGFEIENELSWAAGNKLRDAWIARTGELPEKRLRQKTCGHGSHCFAVYPGIFHREAIAIVAKIADQIYSEKARQMEMF
jgi:hypothetical protein